MRWFKIAAIAGGILIAFLVVGSVIGVIIHAVLDLVVAALVVGAIVAAVKVARSHRQVSRKREERQVRDHARHEPLPRADVEPFSASVPAPQPRRTAPSAQDVDDELARLKREMGS